VEFDNLEERELDLQDLARGEVEQSKTNSGELCNIN
jgi:hypothetical protein